MTAMRIVNVEATWVHIPIAEADSHRSDYGQIRSFDSALVRIETACGLVGWGEAKNAAGSAGRYGALVHLINSELAPALIGRDAREIVAIWEGQYNGVRAEKAVARAQAMPELARSGLSIAAISGVDIALWDLLGKALDAPVWQLLGGRTRTHLPAYGSGGWADIDGIGAELAGYVARGGFKAVKMRVGAMDGSIRASAERVIAARAALGPDVELMCDAHGSFTAADARRFCHLVRDCDIAWFEEPLVVGDARAMAGLRQRTSIPLAAGESEYTRFAFRDLVQQQAVDVLQPDLAVCGGLTESVRIAALAAAFNLRLAPHLWTGAPAFMAGIHLLASSPVGYLAEFSLGANPMLHDLIEENISVADGLIAVPDRPGLGITVREDVVKEYRRDG